MARPAGPAGPAVAEQPGGPAVTAGAAAAATCPTRRTAVADKPPAGRASLPRYPEPPLAPLPISGRPVSATMGALITASRSCAIVCAGLAINAATLAASAPA